MPGIHVHVVEELQEPFHLDVFRAPHELRSPNDAYRTRQVADNIARRVCGVDHAGDRKSDYGDVDRKVLPPRLRAQRIDAKKSDKKNSLDRGGDEEVQCHDCRDQGGGYGPEEYGTELWYSLDARL